MQVDAIGNLAGRRDVHDAVAEVVAFLDQSDLIQKLGQHSRKFMISRVDLHCLQEVLDEADTVAIHPGDVRKLRIGVGLHWFDLE